jgi:hypothetical protein
MYRPAIIFVFFIQYLALYNKVGDVCVIKCSGAFANHCCRGQGISILYSECVFIALAIQHAMRMHCMVL